MWIKYYNSPTHNWYFEANFFFFFRLFYLSSHLYTTHLPLSPPPPKRSFGGRPSKICTIFYQLPGAVEISVISHPILLCFRWNLAELAHLTKDDHSQNKATWKIETKTFFLFAKENKTFKMNEMLLCIHRQETWNLIKFQNFKNYWLNEIWSIISMQSTAPWCPDNKRYPCQCSTSNSQKTSLPPRISTQALHLEPFISQ